MTEIVEIVLEAPGKNALGSAAMAGLRERLRSAGGAPILLSGAGNAFSAGLDVKEVASLDADGMRRYLGLLVATVEQLYLYPGPTVANVNGHAIAGGCVLVLACDHRVATSDERARIGLNEVALGLRFPPQVLLLARDRLGPEHATRVVLGAGLHDPETARDLGLVDEVAGDSDAAASERLAALAALPPDAYATAKAHLRRGRLTPGDELRRRWETEDLPTWTSRALRDRIAAMLAK